MKLKQILSKIFLDPQVINDKKFLKTVSLFKDLSNKELGAILTISDQKYYKKDEEVFREGTPGNVLYIIKEGSVAGFRDDKEIFRLNKSHYFGEIALIDDTIRSATVKTLEDSVLILIYKSKFDGFLDDYPRSGIKIIKIIAKDICKRLRVQNNN